nr:NADH dehydrogenase subunit 4 [Degeeriella rufa]
MFVVIILLSMTCPSGGMVVGLIDEVVVRTMVVISSLVMMWVCLSSKSRQVLLIASVVYFMSILMFTVDSVFWMFVWFESSMVPMALIVTMTGVQFERMSACAYMIVYTVVFGSVFILAMFFSGLESVDLDLDKSLSLSSTGEKGAVFAMSLAFLMKIPMFMLHPWLPKAHLESGVTGSILLAGVLLKMGVYGMIQLLMGFGDMKWDSVFLTVSLMGIVYTSWLSLSSSDVKMTVAYSSVSHMNFVLAVLLTGVSSCIYSVLITSLCHSVVSVILFSFVTALYEMTGSRSYVVSKGSSSLDSPMRWGNYVFWTLNMCLPPTMCFTGEVMLILSAAKYNPLSVVIVLGGVFMMSCVCVVNCIVLQHETNKPLLKKNAILWPILGGGVWGTCLAMLFFGSDMTM